MVLTEPLRACVLITLVFLSRLTFAEVNIVELALPGVYEVHLAGTITPPDYRYLVERIKSLPRRNASKQVIFRYILDSSGGDIRTAMQIGRFLRSTQARAEVPQEATCASACVFVLAGAVVRVVDGRIAIHRPFNPVDLETSPDAQRAVFQRLEAEVKKYLKEMNISTALYDDMIYISSTTAKFLGPDELQRYGLSEWDPYYEQSQHAARAKEIGITMAEYMRRVSRADRVCGRTLEGMSEDAQVRAMECHGDIVNGRR